MVQRPGILRLRVRIIGTSSVTAIFFQPVVENGSPQEVAALYASVALKSNLHRLCDRFFVVIRQAPDGEEKNRNPYELHRDERTPGNKDPVDENRCHGETELRDGRDGGVSIFEAFVINEERHHA